VPNSRLVTAADAARAYAYASDTRYIPTLHEYLQGVTTLYHEATYAEDNLPMAEKYYHSTARQAALVARDAGVGQLLLGHYSSRYEDENLLLREAQSIYPKARLVKEMDVIDV
jgi:ribonuclease Z